MEPLQASRSSGQLPVVAHHSFSAEFDATKPITLKGKLTKMDWVNPHGWLYIDVMQPDGKVVNWAIEAGSPNALLRRGLRQTDFPIGSELIIDGYRSKNGSPHGQRHVREICRRPELLSRRGIRRHNRGSPAVKRLRRAPG